MGKGKKRSLDVVSMSSLVGAPGKTWDTKLLLSAVVDGAKVADQGDMAGTMKVLWQVLLWSFAALCRGRWPHLDWRGDPWPEGTWRAKTAGEQLCGDYVFPMMCVSADLDYLCNYFDLQHFNDGQHPCFRCGCNRTDMVWSDMRPDASWRSALITPATWMLKPKHPIFEASRVGLNVWHVCIDVLHILDLGMCQHVGGSVLYLLAFDAGLAGGLDERVNRLWEYCGEAYDALGTPAGERLPRAVYLALWEHSRRPTPTKYPTLGSKGAVCRHTMPMLNLVLRRLGPDTDTFGHVRFMLEGLCTFYNVIAAEGMWLEPGAALEAEQGLLRAGVHLQTLCHQSMTSGRQLFHMTEKSHYAQHIGLDLLRTGSNPRFGWTYGDEDFMGRISQVCRPCLKGRGHCASVSLSSSDGGNACMCVGNGVAGAEPANSTDTQQS